MSANGFGPNLPIAEPPPHEWYDSNPFYLMIYRPSGDSIRIDLGEHGWLTTYAEWMRGRSRWFLVQKDGDRVLFTLEVQEDDQPYYTARHVGVAGSGGSNEIVAYGIGAKRASGMVDRLWILPDGTVCVGDDVGSLGVSLLHQIGPR